MAASPYSVVRQRREQRHMRLVALGYGDYADYLRSPHWRQTKARYWVSDQPQDCMCGEIEGLQLHHMTYERIGDEELTDLTPLCPNCHQMVHALERRGEIGLDFAGLVNDQRAARYAEQRSVVDWREERKAEQDRRLAAEEQRFLRSLLARRLLAEQLGINVDTDINFILRRYRIIQRKLGYEPQPFIPSQ